MAIMVMPQTGGCNRNSNNGHLAITVIWQLGDCNQNGNLLLR